MKAVEIHHYGGPEELKYEEAPLPAISPDEVLVKIYASGVNPIDYKIRQGSRSKENGHFPRILGWDFSGVIEKVGDNVVGWKTGDEVYGRPDPSRDGTYAEYAAVKVGEFGRKPVSVDHKAASGIALAGLTALQGLFEHGRLQEGDRVLIHGAAGGVGTFAVQLAKWKGAYVLATSSARNALYLEELGVDEVIDYEKEDFSQRVTDIDVVLDTRGGKTQEDSIRVLKPGGRLVSTVGIKDAETIRSKGIVPVSFMAQSRTEDLRQLSNLIDSGQLIPVVSQILPLKDAAEAHRLLEQGHTRGKIILQVVEENNS